MTLHWSNMDVITVAVVQYLVHGGISKNHCSSGKLPMPISAPPLPPRKLSMVTVRF